MSQRRADSDIFRAKCLYRANSDRIQFSPLNRINDDRWVAGLVSFYLTVLPIPHRVTLGTSFTSRW